MPGDKKSRTPGSVVMNTSPVCKLFVVLSWYADEPGDMDDPAELAEYLAEVADRFDREDGEDGEVARPDSRAHSGRTVGVCGRGASKSKPSGN